MGETKLNINSHVWINNSCQKKLEKCIRETSNVDVFIQEKIRLVFRTESYTAQKMKFSIKDFFSKCDQIRSKLRNDRFCAMIDLWHKKQLSRLEWIIFNKYLVIFKIVIKKSFLTSKILLSYCFFRQRLFFHLNLISKYCRPILQQLCYKLWAGELSINQFIHWYMAARISENLQNFN